MERRYDWRKDVMSEQMMRITLKIIEKSKKCKERKVGRHIEGRKEVKKSG